MSWTRSRTRWTLGGLMTLILVGCAPAAPPARTESAVSGAPLTPGQPVERVAPLPRVEVEYGEGDCAPRYSNGARGTCINNRPCNGFGFRDASGRLECACFAVKGGCPDGQACSVRSRTCGLPPDADIKRAP